jgi:hypothetical protein
VEFLDPVGIERLALVPGHLETGFPPPRRQVVVEPGPDLVAEGFRLRGIGQVHHPKVPPGAAHGQGSWRQDGDGDGGRAKCGTDEAVDGIGARRVEPAFADSSDPTSE